MEKELQVAVSSMTPQYGKLRAERQSHPLYSIRHVQLAVHEPLQDVMLLANNMKLPSMLNMLHLITNTVAHRQSWRLCSRKQNKDSVLYFIAAQKSVIPLCCRIGMNNTRQKR
jgi:hypothetical protein